MAFTFYLFMHFPFNIYVYAVWFVFLSTWLQTQAPGGTKPVPHTMLHVALEYLFNIYRTDIWNNYNWQNKRKACIFKQFIEFQKQIISTNNTIQFKIAH